MVWGWRVNSHRFKILVLAMPAYCSERPRARFSYYVSRSITNVSPARTATSTTSYPLEFAANWRRLTPDVGVVVRHPASAAIVHARTLGAANAQVANQVKKGQMAFTEVRRFGVPVIHLRIGQYSVLYFLLTLAR